MKTFYEKLTERMENNRIRMMAIHNETSEFDAKIMEFCHKLQLPPQSEGSVYLRVAMKVLLCLEENNFYNEKSVIYAISKAFDETVEIVETKMEHAIRIAWYTMDVKVLEKVFGEEEWHNIPSNSRFIADCVGFIRAGVVLQ